MPAPAVMWFRRDLRLGDNPALAAAVHAGPVLPLFVVDPALWEPAGPARRGYLSRSLSALDADLRKRGGRLVVRHGDPAEVLPRVAGEAGAESVHVAADHGPYGRARDEQVAAALAEDRIALERTGSPYAVAPGEVLTRQGTGYQVFTPFFRAWAEHGWPPPVEPPGRVSWCEVAGDPLPSASPPDGLQLPDAGERAAHRAWRTFLDRVEEYDEGRDRPAVETSHMSVHLKWGEIHPRTLLADLSSGGPGAASYRRQLAWREFFADVLWHHPETARTYLRPGFAAMEHDEPGDAFRAWTKGRTGFPIVDAGMRQLRATGWMHNRVRMVVASFLVKDLHVEWQHGARHFMRWLVDGDLASNQHNWQWVAGCGADAAPYFRIFNPTTQARRFDPDGAYVRTWVPELRGLDASHVHEPVRAPGGPPDGYPAAIVDHDVERREALARLDRVRRGSRHTDNEHRKRA
ncbi:MAG TPA: deoxyribodipyrimidine photo-lyase [Nocardioidaceae bacterium]|nr:deoxyribodipyrimidine photo-lyase [Nocardioidaceae bacterium]